MGSSTKKAKSSKDNRKRRHRSPSNSEEPPPRDKQHRHRRHHKEKRHEKPARQKEFESDGSDILAPSPQHHHRDATPPPPQIRDSSPPVNNQSVDSLSIDETNKLRAKLGLKPLEIGSHSADSSSSRSKDEHSKHKDDLGEFYHKPASNISESRKQEKLRRRLSEKKEKRHIDAKLSKVKTLGESDEEEDAESWVEKNRRIQFDKAQAAKRAKVLEELDAEFGIGDIVESVSKAKKARVYSDRHLKGLKVEHAVSNFTDGKNVILTLKDSDVLAEDRDVLVNVNMVDDERYEKSNENKKTKPGYKAYDDDEFDEFGNAKRKSLLSKYDEEIDGVQKKDFVIGDISTTAEFRKSVAQTVKEKLSNKRLESLILPELNLASEYYTEEEMTKFKKPKLRKKKLRQKSRVLTAAELAAQVDAEAAKASDHGSRRRELTEKRGEPAPSKGEFTDWMDIDDLPAMKPILDNYNAEPEDANLERALHKARRIKQKEALTTLPSVSSLIKQEPEVQHSEDVGSIVLNSTAEFCRTLGDIPTYGKAGNRDEDADLIDFDGDIKESPSASPEHQSTSAWNNVDLMDVTETHIAPPEAPILDEEPDVGAGVGSALKLAMSKGYLDKEENNRPSTSKFAHLQARHYSIEDKTYGDDDKFGGRRERYQGPTQDFKEKDTFRPNVKLEYIDDDGRVLNPKEAFRYLSHKFHGKGPGKNKIEKRIKKSEQEGLMKKMSSTDTPLGTLNMLQHKQKEMQSAYIVLSGSKHTHSTTISKARR